MIDTFVDFISKNNTVPVVAIIIAVILMVSFFQSRYIMFTKVSEIKKETSGKINKYVDEVLLEAEEISFDRGREIMEERWVELSTCVHGETELSCEYLRTYFPREVEKFHNILHSSLEKTRYSIMQHLDINGFHDKEGLDLIQYYTRVGTELFEYNKRVMRIRGIDSMPLIKDTHGLRFTKQEAINKCGKIVNYAVKTKKEETQKIKNIRKNLRLHNKISEIVRGVLDG